MTKAVVVAMAEAAKVTAKEAAAMLGMAAAGLLAVSVAMEVLAMTRVVVAGQQLEAEHLQVVLAAQ